NRNDFEDLGAGTRTLAFASGNRGLIVIDNSRIRTEPLNLGSILSHEWVHLVLHEQIPPGRLPRWLNEGLAQRIGGGTAEIVLMEGTGKRLQQAVLSNRRMEFHDLSADFPHKDPGLSLAYEQSRSFVDYLFDRIGREGMLKALRSLTQGGSIEMSLETAAGIPFQDLEGGWRETLNRRVTWLAYISNNFPFFLFLFAAGLTVLGFFRMLIQRRNYRDEDEFS
ncbi:MAG TPA: hypothetical protein VLB09_09230, partial [Nitrospiria bacterium]|nr:hypothetical protein [Nitrospiria bacterium]